MKKITLKTLSLILSIAFVFASVNTCAFAKGETTTENTTTADEATTEITQEEAQQTLEEQRTSLEQRLKESEEKLASYSDDQKETEEYIDALDEKIGYLNEELTLLENEVKEAKSKSKKLKKQINSLNDDIDELQVKYDEAVAQLDSLNNKFQSTYNAYCLRVRAIYISGKTSIIAALLTCKDLAQLYSRYEMIKAISKSDTQLMTEVSQQIDEITSQQSELNTEKTELETKKASLDKKQAQYTKQQNTIESKQSQIATKKIKLAEERAESDRLLSEYCKKTEMYTEYMNEDEELIEALEQEIDDLINGLKDPSEVTTVDDELKSTGDSSSTSDDNTLYSRSNAVLNMTYPVPGHTYMSQVFGHVRLGQKHPGIDYPCPMKSKVVAAQKGIVILTKRVNYGYGYYVMIYHGTDKKGRKIVTLYGHNSSILVSVGQTVSKGQQIAKSGSTGNSTGPHCHFEIRMNGEKVNPQNYLSK